VRPSAGGIESRRAEPIGSRSRFIVNSIFGDCKWRQLSTSVWYRSFGYRAAAAIADSLQKRKPRLGEAGLSNGEAEVGTARFMSRSTAADKVSIDKGVGSGPRPLVYVIEFNNRGPRRTRSNRSGVTPMLAEKYILLLETLRKGLPDRSQTHTDGGPRVISNSPHIPVRLPAESQPAGNLMVD
jgi:hypothetical protein